MESIQTQILSRLDGIASDLNEVKIQMAEMSGSLKVQKSELQALERVVADARTECRNDTDALNDRMREVEAQQAAESSKVAAHSKALWMLAGTTLSVGAGMAATAIRVAFGG